MVGLAAQQSLAHIAPSDETLEVEQTARFTRYWLVSRSLMLLWLLLSLWQIGAFPVADGEDEAITILMGFRLASFVDDPLALGSPIVQGQLPLSYLPSVLGAHLLPVSEFTLRLPYALIGATQMPLLLALSSRVFGRRAAALAGLMLLGTGLFAVNRLAGGAGVFMALELAGALLLLRYVESGERRWAVLSSAAFGAAALTHESGSVLLAVAIGVAWWARRNRGDVVAAGFAGPALLAGFFVLALIANATYANWDGAPTDLSNDGLFSNSFGFSLSSFGSAWIVYLGVPVVLLVLIGLFEAAVHSTPARKPLIVLMALAAAGALPWLVLGSHVENPVLVAPLLLAVAGFGCMQMIRQFESVAAQSLVAMAVASVAMAGVVWNQAVFNPETEFNDDLQSLRQYALSLDHGSGLFEEDAQGIQAIADVIRQETPADARVFASEGVPAAAIELYAARETEALEIRLFAEHSDGLDGAYLVIKGEDESYNAGLSGATNVVANHRVFADGESLYQLVQFSTSGEPFETPVWWRADVAEARLFRENTRYTEFLTP